MSGLFIAGVDTGVGKTLVCGLLAACFAEMGSRVITQKWVQTGCAGEAEDLIIHRHLSGIIADGSMNALLNPYCFHFAASPHLAAELEGEVINPARIVTAYRELEKRYDIVLVEGAGGLLVPLSRELLLIELVAQLSLPVVLVVANRLGCINHALLSIAELKRRHISIAGLVFNTLPTDKTDARIIADNPRIISLLGGVPLYAELPPLTQLADGKKLLRSFAEKVAASLNWDDDE